jgi:hypothetical protein
LHREERGALDGRKTGDVLTIEEFAAYSKIPKSTVTSL